MARRLVLALPLIIAAQVLAQDKAAQSYTVPFEFKANVILLKGTVNGKPDRIFVFDTGAEKNLLIPSAAQECGVSGNSADIDLYGAVAKGTEVVVTDLPQLQPLRQYGVNYSGVIGYPFLAKFITTFDYKNQKLIMVPADKAPKFEKKDKNWILDFKLVRSVILLENIKVNGKGPYTFLLDSGASETVVMPDAARAIGLQGQMVPSQTVGQVEQCKGQTIAAGDAEVRGIDVCVYDPPQARPLKAANGGKLDGLLGRSFFDRFLLTIDYRNSQIKLESFDAKPEPAKKKEPAKTPKKK